MKGVLYFPKDSNGRIQTAAVRGVALDRAFASHAGERGSTPCRDRPLEVVNSGSDSSTANRSAKGVSVTGHR